MTAATSENSHWIHRALPALPGVLLAVVLARGPGAHGFGHSERIGLAIGVAVAMLGVLLAAALPKVRKQLSFAATSTVIAVIVLEIAISVFVWRFGRARDSCWLFENSDRTFQFDPIRGYRLTTVPARFARITHGELEYVGAYRGNAQGFQDRDDFAPRGTPGGPRRIAVFGDSFTTGAFLQLNWPDRAEDLSRASGAPVQLLNFGVDGAGLANWASVLRGIIEQDDYQLDAVVFAVFYDDLWRTFSFAEHRGYHEHMFARATTWDPSRVPHTDAEARAALGSMGAPIVTTAAMERALQTLRCPTPQEARRFQPVLATTVASLFRLATTPVDPGGAAPLPPEDPHRVALIQGIAETLRARGLRSYVVFVPTRDHLVEPEQYNPDPAVDDIRRFAATLGAPFIDGRDAFRGLSRAECARGFFKYDGHWNQIGSDRFAAFMVRQLRN